MPGMEAVDHGSQIAPGPEAKAFRRVPAVIGFKYLPLFQSATGIGYTIWIQFIQLFIERLFQYGDPAFVALFDIG